MDKSRFFENTLGGYDGQTVLIQDDKKLIGKISEDIKHFITSRLHELEGVYRATIQRNKFDGRHDSSVYTGTAGAVLLAQKVSFSSNHDWSTSLAFAETLLLKARPGNDGITFLCGDAGILALGATHCNNNGDIEGRKKYVDALLKLASLSSERKLDNEMLYGWAGYLFALLFVRQQINESLIPDAAIYQVVEHLIGAGLKSAKHNKNSVLPLHYLWYGDEYVGAAHGYVGILYMILQANLLCPGSVSKNHEELLISCLDILLDKRFPSGNLRSCMGTESDRLIHWCHGAPGAIHLYALAYKVFKKESYLSAARCFADNIWSRGLLKRGYGICHGVSGNGYAFLCMFQLTNEKEYLWKAIKFAEWCLLYGEHDCRVPDNPYSLFEGIAGTLYFLHDMLLPEAAMFPAFQLVSYQ